MQWVVRISGLSIFFLGILKEYDAVRWGDGKKSCVAAFTLHNFGFTYEGVLEMVKRYYGDHKDYQHYRDLPVEKDNAHDAVVTEDTQTHEDFVRLTSPLGRPLYIRKLSITCIRDYGKGDINNRRVWVGSVVHYVRESVDEIMVLIAK